MQSIIIQMLHMKKLHFKEINSPAQDHKAQN